MKLNQFDYQLNKNLIAQYPTKKREKARLLVYHPANQSIKHNTFSKIASYFDKGDVLVLNNSKVIPARLFGHTELGSKVEMLLLKMIKSKEWECLLKASGKKKNILISFPQGLSGKVVKEKKGIFTVRFNIGGQSFLKLINRIGWAPLPPYIKRGKKNFKDNIRYQTVYAAKLGSVAAPTAGLHFTKNLLNKLKKKGVQIEYITLHIGLGTFQPVKVDDIKKHQMHSERIEVSRETIRRLVKAKKQSRRVIAVGTTSVRVLESVIAENLNKSRVKDVSKEINTFIYPGYKFKITDGLITNFHLPKSTLLMLVSAFIQDKGVKDGVKEIKRVYRLAQQKKYRFFSYGDAMLIL